MTKLATLGWTVAAALLLGGPAAAAPLPPCTSVDDGPSRLVATVSGSTVTLQWLAPSGCAPTSYVLVAGSGPNLANILDIAVGAAPTLTATGVPAGLYYVRVLSQVGGTRSLPSNDVVVAVDLGCQVPDAPSAFAAMATASTASFAWDAPPAAPTGYLLEAGSGPGRADLATLPLGAGTSFTTGAPSGVFYTRVRARNACGVGPASNEMIAVVAAPLAVPPVTTVASPVVLTGSQIVVVSGVDLTIRGRIDLHDHSILIIRDGVFRHVADYAGQFDLWAYDDSRVILERSRLDSSVYMSWHFFDRSRLQEVHVTNATSLWNGFQQHARGSFVHVTRAFGTGAEGTELQVHHADESFIELVFPAGGVVDEAFPVVVAAASYRFPGVDEREVRHTLTMTDAARTSWGITYQPETDVTIRHSRRLVVTFNIPRTYSGLTAQFDGVRSTLYADQTWTTGGARLRLVDTFTEPWSPIVAGNNTLIITNSELADITRVFDTATVFIADSTLSQARALQGVHYTLERSHVSGDVVASDRSVLTMNGGGVGGRAVRDPGAQMFFTGVRAATPGFSWGHLSQVTAAPVEVLAGAASLKAASVGDHPYVSVIRSRSAAAPLVRGRSYRVSFRYRIVTAPSAGFELSFYSPTAYAQGVFLPNTVLTGPAGATGTVTLTNTVGAYDDYEAVLSIVDRGALVIDDFRIEDLTAGSSVIDSIETLLTPP